MVRWDSYRRELNSFTEINLTNINFRIRYFNSEPFWVDRKRTITVFPPINYKSGSRECTLNNIKHPKIPDDLTSYSYQRRHESGGGRAYRRQWERVRRFNRIFIFTLFLFYNSQLVSLIKKMLSLIVCLNPLKFWKVVVLKCFLHSAFESIFPLFHLHFAYSKFHFIHFCRCSQSIKFANLRCSYFTTPNLLVWSKACFLWLFVQICADIWNNHGFSRWIFPHVALSKAYSTLHIPTFIVSIFLLIHTNVP